MAVGFILFNEIEAQIIEGKRYPCSDWQGVTGTSLYSMAQSPNWIGDPSTNQGRFKTIKHFKHSGTARFMKTVPLQCTIF